MTTIWAYLPVALVFGITPGPDAALALRRARLILEEEVKQLRHILIQRGQYQLPLLGTLELTGAGKINFVPYSSSKLLQGIN